MPIRLSGISSGLDTDALIKELVSAYNLKTQKYEKQQTKVEWKKESWQSLNTKIYSLYTNISSLRYDSAYNLKKTMVSDSTKASVTASSSAASGTQKLKITSTAQACYITGAKLGDDIKGSTKLKELGVSGKTTLTINRDGGKDVTIDISEDNTVEGLMQKLRDNDLNANFDENNHRVYISAKDSGAAGNFTLESDDIGVKSLISALGLNSATQEEEYLLAQAKAYDKDLESWQSLSTALGENVDAVTAYEKDVDAYKNVQARYKASDALKQIVDAAAGKNIKTEDLLTEDFLALVNTKDTENAESTTEEAIKAHLKAKGLNDEDIKKIDAHIKTIAEYSADTNDATSKITVDSISEDALQQLDKDLNDEESALKKKYDAATEALKIKNRLDAYEKDADVMTVVAKATEEERKAAAGAIVTAMANAENNPREFATRIDGEDATIVLNDVTYTSSSNSFNINGLTIEAYAKTTDEISITTSTDTQGIYDKIKDFLTEYNTVINEITKLYNADVVKGYEPLTDEEKEAMSDDQIEKWENKIKDGILRRDTSLGSIMNTMVNTMSQSINVNGTNLSLSNFGISTLGFLNAAQHQQYAFHIDGDEDDAKTSGKEDKLMKAIQQDPDQVVAFMKQLTSNLHKAVDEKMKSTELSSAYKVYNDKEIDKEIKNYENLIKKWEDKVAAEEDRYYKQFSDMEVALSKLQSQTSALSGLLGQ